MRTFEEVQRDIVRASTFTDAAALQTLASEMQALGTRESEAAALSALGTAATFTGDYPQALDLFRLKQWIDIGAAATLMLLESKRKLFGLPAIWGQLYIRSGDYKKALEHSGCSERLAVDGRSIPRCLPSLAGGHGHQQCSSLYTDTPGIGRVYLQALCATYGRYALQVHDESADAG